MTSGEHSGSRPVEGSHGRSGEGAGSGTAGTSFRPRLRTSLLAAVLFGGILPMAVVGLWLAQSTQRSAEVLVQDRLQGTLAELALEVGTHWGEHRGRILRLAEVDQLAELMVGGQANVSEELGAVWADLAGTVERAVVRDAGGNPLLEFEREGSASGGGFQETGLVPVSLAVHDRLTGERIGVLEAWLLPRALVPGGVFVPGVSGSVLALFDPADGTSLLPLPMVPELFHGSGFEWRDERWTVARHRLYDPPLVLGLAAPLGAFSEPFEQAGRRGVSALVAVSLLAFLLIGLASRGLTRSLGALADGADHVTAGRLERRVPEAGPDEIFRVARAFNSMTASLHATLDRLSQQEALAAMGEMAASLAHEVRNPLSAIRLDLQRAERRLAAGEEGAAELVHRALNEIHRLDASVTSALEMSRTTRVEPVALELAEPLQAALHAARPAFRETGAELVAPVDLGRKHQVLGDAATLKQLFLNLLLNAAEAVGPGGRAGVDVEDQGERLRVAVWDEGPGISPAVRDRVLEPFVSTRPEGTGLGLPIARRIARAHGSDLEVESEPGRGTVVAVALAKAEDGSVP